MPRRKNFDPEEKLDQALELFWRRGCDAVSVQDIVDTLDLNRGSLYSTYGDKEQLWLAALCRYCDQGNAMLADLFAESSEPVLPRIRQLLLGHAAPRGAQPHGCLVVNAATERTHDPATREIVESQLNHTEEVLEKAFTRAHANGEIPASSSPSDLARFVVVMMQGLQVYDRALTDPSRARRAVEVALFAINSGAQATSCEAVQAESSKEISGMSTQ